jgi:hypothetical protein
MKPFVVGRQPSDRLEFTFLRVGLTHRPRRLSGANIILRFRAQRGEE